TARRSFAVHVIQEAFGYDGAPIEPCGSWRRPMRMSLTRGLCVTLMAVGLLPPGRAAIAAGSAGTALAVDHLKVEYKTNPLGIGVAAPRLSWQISGAARGLAQTEYQIRVAY